MNEREEELQAVCEVQDEFKKANRAHPPHASPHETYGLLCEELAEFFDEVRKKEAMRSPLAMRKELAQVAAAAIRGMLALDMDAPRRMISNPITPGSPLDEAINGRRQHRHHDEANKEADVGRGARPSPRYDKAEPVEVTMDGEDMMPTGGDLL